MKMEPIEGSETSAFKPQTPGKYPKENILHKVHGESLKSRQILKCWITSCRNNGYFARIPLCTSAPKKKKTLMAFVEYSLDPNKFPYEICVYITNHLHFITMF
jgi:hypothetical protein